MLKSLKKNNYLIVYFFLIALINLFLLTLPLASVFGYEFSAINALLLSFISGLYIISYLKQNSTEKNKIVLAHLLKSFALMLLIPFAISIIKSIFTGFCSFWDGLWFYLLITVPSVIIGAGLGCFIFFIIPKIRFISFILLYILILIIIPASEIYFYPQIYLYNPLFAYFPGTIYDEGVVVDFKLFLYRIFNLLFFTAALLFFLKWKIKYSSKSSAKLFVVFLIVIAAIFYFIISPAIGFITTESSIKNSLSKQVETEHFIIHAENRIPNKDLELIAVNQEYYYSRLSNFFNTKPDKKITSYIFLNGEQKKELFGSENADVAKPWLYSIYISFDSWEGTLKHEIAHCFTADFGWGIFKLAHNFNPALIEGAAEAGDGFYDENGIHFLASLAFKNNYKINIESLFDYFSFFGSVSSLSYIYSGSFVKYLITNYGIDKFKILYQTNDFDKVYDKNLSELSSNYKNFLDTLTVVSTKAKADYYFGRKPLIIKVCPRYISSRLEEAWRHYNRKDNLIAEKIFKDILSKTDNFSALVGLSKIYEDQDSIWNAINLLQLNAENFTGTSNEFDLKFRLAELFVKNSEFNKAEELYNLISQKRPSRRLQLLADSRIALIKEGTIKEYVKGSDFDKYTILKKLNSKNYVYAAIPLMIDLSVMLGENYNLFLENFKQNFEVKDEQSSYAVFKISQYSLSNFDIINARKLASLSLRYKNNPDLNEVLKSNFTKTDWFVRNAEVILTGLKITPD
jgi:hypothetical protein